MKSYLCFFMLTPFFSHAMHNDAAKCVASIYANTHSHNTRLVEHPQPRAAQDATAPLLTSITDPEPLIMPVPSPINADEKTNRVYYTPLSDTASISLSDDDESDRVIVKRKKESLCNKHNVGTCVVVSCCCCLATLFAAFMFCYPLVNV